MTEPTRRPDELLLDELTDQLDRTRRLLTALVWFALPAMIAAGFLVF